MNFRQFKELVLSECVPQRDSNRLDARHEGWIKNGLIEIQVKVPCLQEEHREYISQDATFYSCGAVAFPAPNGYIKSLRVQGLENDCLYTDAVAYTEAMFRTVLQRLQRACTPPTGGVMADAYYGYAYDYGTVDPELKPSTPAIDLASTPSDYAFALFEGNVWLWPVLNSDQVAVLKWTGIKKNWKPDDRMTWVDEKGEIDREVVELINSYFLSKYYLHDKCDPEKAGAAAFDYRKKLAEMIVDCTNRRRIATQVRYFPN